MTCGVGGRGTGVVGVVVHWVWQGGKVKAGGVIHRLFFRVVDALFEDG